MKIFAKLKSKIAVKFAAASAVLAACMGIACNAAPTTSGPVDFSTGMGNFGTFVEEIISGWVSVVFAILEPSMWILMLPIFTYIFVVATASLRSFYKG